MANDKIIKEIADKLNNHGSQVNPQMWQAVSSQVGTSGAAGVGSAIGAGKVAAIVVGIAAVSVASYFGFKPDENPSEPTTNTNRVAQTDVTSEATKNETIETTDIVKQENLTATTVENTKSTGTEIKEDVSNTPVNSVDPEAIQIHVPGYIGVRTIDNTPKTIKSTKGANTTTNVTSTTQKKDEVINTTSKPKADETPKTTSAINPIKTNINVFTPNGDGINDYFEVQSVGLKDYSIVIMDAQNKKVWESKDPNAKWDGKDMSGQTVKRGRYLCLIAGNGPDGKPFGKHEILNIRY